MKKITSLILTLILLFGAVFNLASCSDDDVPKDMRLVRGGEEYGYYFYGPEEWVVANVGNISATYAAKIDTTSITMTSAEAPEGRDIASVEKYFESHRDSYPSEITVTEKLTACDVGVNNDIKNRSSKAYRISFEYEYNEKKLATVQVFAFYKNDFYIITYTSYNSERTEGETYFEFYEAKWNEVLKNVKFVDRKVPAPSPEAEGDGSFVLVSDKAVAGYELYLPNTYKVTFSSGIVTAEDSEGRSITVSRATFTNARFTEYFNKREDDLKRVVDDFATVDVKLSFEGDKITDYNERGNPYYRLTQPSSNSAMSFKYTYTLEGEEYYVYQVLMASSQDAFTFTYTAKGDFPAQDTEEYKKLSEALKALEMMEY